MDANGKVCVGYGCEPSQVATVIGRLFGISADGILEKYQKKNTPEDPRRYAQGLPADGIKRFPIGTF